MFPNELTVDVLNQMNQGNMGEHLGLVFTEIGDDYICAKMPVDHRTIQPLGLLHGGANAVLAETLGSVAAHSTLDHSKQYAVGLEINVNHIKSARAGFVYGKTTPVHVGRRTHVWNIEITNENGQLIAVSRITMAILDVKH